MRDEAKRCLHPKLRMIRNGDEEVNARRAGLSGAVQVSAAPGGKVDTPAAAAGAAEPTAAPEAAGGVRVGVFIELEDARTTQEPVRPSARRGRLMTAELTPAEMEEVAGRPGVAYVSSGDVLSAPLPIVSPRHFEAPAPRGIFAPASGARPPVLVGIIDVGGFDFAHEDFLRPDGSTRFLRIWDQGGKRHDRPKGFSDGAEITDVHMNRALESRARFRVAATDLESQSIQVPGSHATHVASIAAGNRGVCPEAAIAGVLLALSEGEVERRRSLYDSTRLAHAVDYLFGLGAELDLPVAINISLGTNGHAHDGSSPINRWIDSALRVPGRCVCVAAGNAGQDAPQSQGDLGHLMGRIHTSGHIAASGLETDVEWLVVGNGLADDSENELELWYEAQDIFEVTIRTPSGQWIGPVRPGHYVQNLELPSRTFLSIYSERYHPANGVNHISIFLSPRLKDPVTGVQAGTWTVRLRGIEVRDGRFDAWIERDDPRPLGRRADQETWRFPSYFSRRSNIDRSSVSSLACGHCVVSVANYDPASERAHVSSGQGPTRDGRFKPEIAAPGTEVVAANGFSPPHRRWRAMTGTSMASPYVTGVAGAMLARQRALTSAQIVGIMRRTAQPLPGADYRWQDATGFGRIRPERCLEEAVSALKQEDLYP